MKTKKELVTPITRKYGKNNLKKTDHQVLLEIRNFTDNIIRINALNSDLSIMYVKPQNLKKGVCYGQSNSNLINARLNKLRDRTSYVMQFIKYIKLDPKKAVIEDFIYRKWNDVYHFFSEVQTEEDYENFFNYLDISSDKLKIENYKIQQKEDNKKLAELGIFEPTGIKEAIEVYQFENLNKKGQYVFNFFNKWFIDLNISDFPIAKFNSVELDNFIRFIISTKKNNLSKKTDSDQYSIETVKNCLKQTKILFKNLYEKKLINDIDYISIKDFQLKTGNKRNAHINYVYNHLDNVFSINYDEFETLKHAASNLKLTLNERNTAKLFVIQTLLGGLRVSELRTITKESFQYINDRYYLFITANKTKKMIDSPLHNDLLPILESINFDIKSIINSMYNEHLKSLAKKLGLNRQIIQKISTANSDEQSIKIYPLYELFTNKLARKALVTLLFNKGFGLEQIAKITKHSLEAIQYYTAILTDSKAVMINKI
jgi:integrase